MDTLLHVCCNEMTVAVCDGVHAGVVVASELIWGQKQKVVEYLERSSAPLPDVIVGADVLLWPAYTLPLLLTVRWLLALKPRYSIRSSQCSIARQHSFPCVVCCLCVR